MGVQIPLRQGFTTRGYSSVGRATALHAVCQEFESPYFHSVQICACFISAIECRRVSALAYGDIAQR